MTDEQIKKLPKAAQNYIRKLEADLEYAKNRLAATLAPAEAQRPAYGDYDENRGKGLPCWQVWFAEFGITVKADKEGVRIMGDGPLIVRPQVTNVITLISEYANPA